MDHLWWAPHMHKKLSGPKMESQLRNTFGQSLISTLGMVKAHQGAANWVTKSRFRTSLVTNQRDDTAQVSLLMCCPTGRTKSCDMSPWNSKFLRQITLMLQGWQPPQPHHQILADFFEPPLSYQKTFISTFIGLTLIDCWLNLSNQRCRV